VTSGCDQIIFATFCCELHLSLQLPCKRSFSFYALEFVSKKKKKNQQTKAKQIKKNKNNWRRFGENPISIWDSINYILADQNLFKQENAKGKIHFTIIGLQTNIINVNLTTLIL